MINNSHASTLQVEETFDQYKITLKCDCWEKECDGGLNVSIDDGGEVHINFTGETKFASEMIMTHHQAIELCNAIKKNIVLIQHKMELGLTELTEENIAAFENRI